MSAPVQVAIVGAGPVGLYLACRLCQLGYRVKLLERLAATRPSSRSIGIHPPALECLAELGLAQSFVKRGVQVERGRVYLDRRYLGSLDFSDCPAPYRFVLTLPQGETEALLERRLRDLDPEALQRCAEVTGLQQTADGVVLDYLDAGQPRMLKAELLLACDGKTSLVRRKLAIPFEGGTYPDSYLMGDFSDKTSFGSDAVIYLHPHGLVESFPLPGRRRRWVVKTETYRADPAPSELIKLVRERTGHSPSLESNDMVSAFGVQRYLARHFVRGRVALLGDAAHVLSPIGGQGMNLGWLNAEALLRLLESGEPLSAYQAQRSVAKRAIRRAEFNMWMGRKWGFPSGRGLAARVILSPPFKGLMARRFTMRGLI